MTYRFKLQEPIAEGVRRIGLEQIEMAEAELAGQEDAARAIHNARRCLKRLRALLRLVRPGLEDDVYRKEAEHLAGIGRLLSDARDGHVMGVTLGKLESLPDTKLPPGTAGRLRKLLASGGARKVRAVGGPDGRRPALARLKPARKLFAGKAVAAVAFEHVRKGLELAYRKGRKAFRTAYDHPSDQSFHTWRKSVQLHWRHTFLLSRGWPDVLSARAAEGRELSRLLGEDHDYAILRAFAETHGGSSLRADDRAALAALCRRCQDQLRAEAEPRGARLFAESAGNLEERIARYWASATRLAAVVSPREPAVERRKSGPRLKRQRRAVA